MILQSIAAAVAAVLRGETVIGALWPPTPKTVGAVYVGDHVLCRTFATQMRGVPGIVTKIEDSGYTVRCFDKTLSNLLPGRLMKWSLLNGDNVDCAYGRGVVTKVGVATCHVNVGGTTYVLNRLAILPVEEPGTGFSENATISLMLRSCGKALVHVDILTGGGRGGGSHAIAPLPASRISCVSS